MDKEALGLYYDRPQDLDMTAHDHNNRGEMK